MSGFNKNKSNVVIVELKQWDKATEANKIADSIIKNTYRTLMTRGMKGCYIYCTDSQLSAYFKELCK